MEVTLHLPDNIGSLSPVAQLDTVMSAAVAVLLKLASDGTAASKASAAIAVAIAAPFGTDTYGYPFKSKAEADAWHAAVAQRDANLADTSGIVQQSELAPGAFDIRGGSLADVEMACVFINETLNAGEFIGPVAELHKLSVFMDPSGVSDARAPLANAPAGYEGTLGTLTLEQQINKLSDFVWTDYHGPVREALNKARARDGNPLI